MRFWAVDVHLGGNVVLMSSRYPAPGTVEGLQALSSASRFFHRLGHDMIERNRRNRT